MTPEQQVKAIHEILSRHDEILHSMDNLTEQRLYLFRNFMNIENEIMRVSRYMYIFHNWIRGWHWRLDQKFQEL